MKVIISHDVDHLFGHDHWFRDLIYPKVWARTAISVVRGRISTKEALLRFISCFRKERHCLDALMDFDKEHGVPSTFFFGMSQGLGMSYCPCEAKPVIQHVHKSGFEIGVHGIAFNNYDGIKREYDTFINLMGFEPCGIRMHYVRFDKNTFCQEAKVGYVFDSTEFDKTNCGMIKAPYKVMNMWEFPLTIMDGYLPQKYEDAKKVTLTKLKQSRDAGLEYVTVLFHDYQFNDGYSAIRDWYIWLIQYIKESKEYSFISYKDAIKELEERYDR